VHLDIAVLNNTKRLEMPFFLWVLPRPNPFDATNQSFDVQIDFRPAEGKTVSIDPAKIEYVSANGIAVAPAKMIEFDESSHKQITNGTIQITKPEHLRLKYETTCSPDIPFKLLIAGAFVPNQTDLPAAINYERSKIVRAGIRLPY